MTTEYRIDGELRYVATLMADVAGSTEITEKLGAERSFLLMQEIVRLSWEKIEAFQGHPINFTGDGIFAVFGAPVAVEKASLNACRAAVAISDLLQAESVRFLEAYGVAPQIRLGIAGGEVLVTGLDLGGEIKPSASGSAVNLASRLQNLAPIGGIACSAQVVADVGAFASFQSLGHKKLKGYAADHEVFQLLGLNRDTANQTAMSQRHQTAFVGRDAQLAQILHWARDHDGAAGLIIEGEAGIGKSRLLSEALAAMAPARQGILGACTTETGRRPLHPLIEILRQAIGWKSGTPHAATVAALAMLTPATEAQFAPLADLISGATSDARISAHDAALAVRQQLIACLTALAVRDDCIMLIEDAHWIDPLSAGVLKELLESRAQPFRILLTRRSAPGTDWLPSERILRLQLRPLTRSDIARIAHDGVVSDAAHSAFIDIVAGKSEGNPFFATEMLRHFNVEDAGRLTASGIGTIQNLVFARFDPLDSATKDALRVAAAIGRSFPLNLLRAVAGLSAAETETVFNRAAGLIEPNPQDPANSGQFVHVLWRETVHGSVPSVRRAQMHRQIGEALEELQQHNLSAVAETLVDHFEQGGVPEKALVHLGTAARNAMRLYALETCDSQLDRAFGLIADAPGLVSDLAHGEMLQLWVRCLDLIGNYAKLIAVLQIHLPRLEGDRSNPHFIECASMKAKAHCHAANYDRSLELIETAIEWAEKSGDAQSVAFAKVVKIRILCDSGRQSLQACQRLFEETRAVAESRADLQLTQMRLYHMVAANRALGRYAEAHSLNDTLLALAQTTEDRHTLVTAHWSRGVLSLLANDVPNTLVAARESLRYAMPGTTHWNVANIALQSARMRAGDPVPLEAFTDVIARCNSFSDMSLRNASQFNCIVWFLLQGQISKAWQAMLQAEKQFAETGSVESRKFLMTLRSELLLGIAGLGPPGQRRPKLALGDMLKALTLRLTARREAEKLLDALVGTDPTPSGYFAARASVGLALLARARRNPVGAAMLFNRSIALYEAENLPLEAARVRSLAGPNAA